jgi:quinol monooxygenase YgiN
MMHIRVRPGCEKPTVDTLSAIERQALSDAGRVNFGWFQDEQDPYQFTLFEQWRSQADLDQHLKGNPGRWEAFVPCLDGEPQSQNLRAVDDLAAPLADDEVRTFVQRWFDTLSAHPDIDELLPMIVTDGMTMQFPDATLTSEAEFRSWYDEVGRANHDQSHHVDQLDVSIDPAAAAAGVELSVLWTTHQEPGGAASVFRARQIWRLVRSFTTGRPAITEYRVVEFDPADDPMPAGRG